MFISGIKRPSIVLAIVSLILVFSLSSKGVVATEGIAQVAQSCLPQRRWMSTPMPAYTFHPLAVETLRGQTYHLIEVNQPEDPNFPWETLIVTHGKKCKNLIPERQEVRTLTQFMPFATAKKLALARYRRWLRSSNGRARIERQLRVIPVQPNVPADLDLDEYLIAPEDAWALRQLGFSIPSRFKVEPVQNGSSTP